MLSLIGSPHIFLNLINQPRGRMMMEMYCGLLLFINSNLILLQLMLRISRTLQASSFAQHFLPTVSLFSWPQRIPVTRHNMFILGGDYSLFPRVRLLQKINSLAQLLPFQSLPKILDPALSFVDPLKFLILLKAYESFSPKQKIELTSSQFNLLMNLNHLLKPPIILAGEMLYRKKSMPRKKIIRLSLIACRERSHWLQVDLQDQA